MSNYVDGNLSIENTTNKINNKCDGQEGKNWTKNDKKNELIFKKFQSCNTKVISVQCDAHTDITYS